MNATARGARTRQHPAMASVALFEIGCSAGLRPRVMRRVLG